MMNTSLEVGQTLSGDIHIANGRRLFSAGHIITEQTLRVLKIWGVRDASVEPAVTNNFDAVQSEKHSQTLAQGTLPALRMLFRDNDAEEFPISCLLRECIALAEKEKASPEGFFSYLYNPSVPESQDLSNVAPASTNDIENLFSCFDGFSEEFFIMTTMLNDVYVTSEAVVSVVDKNERIKDKLIQLCESLVHVSNYKITSVYNCSSFLGNRTVLYLAILLEYIYYVQRSYNSTMIMHHGRYAITTGIAARYIASYLGVYGRECFFSKGLLRDIGCIFYSRFFPDLYNKVRKEAVCNGEDLCAMEKLYIGMSHAEVGGRILKNIGFPSSIERSTHDHHTPFNDVTTKEHAVMHVAEVIARTLTFDPAYDVSAPAVDVAAWGMLNITEANLTELVKIIHLKSKEFIRLAYAE